jgi:hypothetical protein
LKAIAAGAGLASSGFLASPSVFLAFASVLASVFLAASPPQAGTPTARAARSRNLGVVFDMARF